MKKIYETIREAVKLGGIEHTFKDEETCSVDFLVGNENATFQVHLRADEEQELLFCAAAFPINVPQSKIPELCVLINRINNDNNITAFTIDPNSGQLLCRFPCTVDGGVINVKIVIVAMMNVISTIQDHYDELVKAITA